MTLNALDGRIIDEVLRGSLDQVRKICNDPTRSTQYSCIMISSFLAKNYQRIQTLQQRDQVVDNAKFSGWIGQCDLLQLRMLGGKLVSL
jgi:hypothetical protein